MKKGIISLFLLVLILILSACTQKENEAPDIIGVQDEVAIELGETWDALEGVTAIDKEDGDLTKQIAITVMPDVPVENGKITPTETGEYYITYSVKDKKGKMTEAYTTLKVLPKVSEETVFIDYTFEESDVDLNGFNVVFDEPAKGDYTVEKGFLTIFVEHPGDLDYQAKLTKNQIVIEAGATYTFAIKLKASEPIRAHFIINNAEGGWSPYAGMWNLDVATEMKEYTVEFLAEEGSGNAEFLFQFGGKTYDGVDNPEQFMLTIDYIKVTKAIGSLIVNEVFYMDFDNGEYSGWDHRGDGTQQALLEVKDGTLQFVIDKYPNGNNPWEMDLYLETNYDIKAGEMYKIAFDYRTLHDQFFELCFEDSNMDWQIRAGYKEGTFTGEGHFEWSFVASMDLTNLHIKLSLGRGASTTNILTIDNVGFYHLTGDREEKTDITDFVPDATPWGTYNNVDEGAEGVVYVEDGKLIYEIYSFGTSDWYNKLFFENITLTKNGLYTLEFTVKADKKVVGMTGLNVMGKWDPRLWKEVVITEEEQTFKFRMDNQLLFDMTFELLFQFGFPENEGPVKIEFSKIRILRQE